MTNVMLANLLHDITSLKCRSEDHGSWKTVVDQQSKLLTCAEGVLRELAIAEYHSYSSIQGDIYSQWECDISCNHKSIRVSVCDLKL